MLVSAALSLRNAQTMPTVAMRHKSRFSKIQLGPPDPILGVNVAFQKDPSPLKVNVSVGAYRDDNGKPWVPPCVRQAEEILHAKKPDHEYAGILGLADFQKVTQKLVFGSAEHPVLAAKRVITSQSISGTGALRIGGAFLGRFYPSSIYMPAPTWGNHLPVFADSGLTDQKTYRYFDKKTNGLDFAGMMEDLKNAPNGSIVLLHACAHNPTGVDPTPEQWKEINQLCLQKNHLPFFDAAYQGFASGDPERDVWAVRYFLEHDHDGMIICQSFAKNFGLYGERCGAVHFVTANEKEAVNVDSQVKILVRPMYSNPPIYGARIVTTILNDPELTKQWYADLKTMSGRISAMREELVRGLEREGSTRSWKHITDQIGMFCFSGLTPDQCETMTKDWHIYLTKNGRISMAGVTSKNVGYLAQAIHAVTK